MNVAGRFTMALVTLGMMPLYLRWLGAESFGLIGFHLLLQAALGFVSAGLADAANRDAASETSAELLSDRVRRFVGLAWFSGFVGGVLVLIFSRWLATHWLAAETLSIAVVVNAVRLMALMLILQAPFDVHIGILLGGQRHLVANLVLAGAALGRAVVCAATLYWIEASIISFFYSQILVSIGVVLICAFINRASLVECKGGGRTRTTLAGSLRFAIGMSGIALTSMILGQADRWILSRVLPLPEFGLYVLAVTVANLIYYLVTPVQAAYYPVFARLAAPSQLAQLSEQYHEACHRVALLVLPVGAMLIFFAQDVIEMWTQREDFAAQVAPVVMFLVGARLISALNSLPYTLQFSHGWTGFVLRSNLIGIVVFVPVIYFLAIKFGAVGAAAGYFFLNVPFLLVVVWMTHRRLLPGASSRWFLHDTALPLVVAFAAAGLSKFLQPVNLDLVARAMSVVIGALVTVAAVAATAPQVFAPMFKKWRLRESAR